MFRILLRLLRTHGISKGANMAKNLGFSSKDILKAKIQTVKKVKKLPERDIVKVYRGYPEWYKGSMIKSGNFVGGEGAAIGARHGGMFDKLPKLGSLYTSTNKSFAKHYATKIPNEARQKLEFLKLRGLSPARQEKFAQLAAKPPGPVLEFHVPKSFLSKYGIKSRQLQVKGDPTAQGITYAFPEGLPREFLRKVHKITD